MDHVRVLKDLGAKAFGNKNFKDALELYTQALQQSTPLEGVSSTAAAGNTANSSEVAALHSNIAAVLLKLDRPEQALQHATAATQLHPAWPKGWYRQASALQALQQHQAATAALQHALQLVGPGTEEASSIKHKLATVAALALQQQAHESVQQGLLASHAAWAKNTAREARTRSELTQQLQQGMAGPPWEPEDWEWRATWTPSMRRAGAAAAGGSASQQPAALVDTPAPGIGTGNDRRSQAAEQTTQGSPAGSPAAGSMPMEVAGERLLAALDVPPGSTKQQQEQVKQLLAHLTISLAELEAPQRGLKLLQDQPLLSWYQHSIRAAVAAAAAETGRAPLVLVLANGGGGLLALLAAAEGAGHVVAVEKWRWGCRASKQLLQANQKTHLDLVSRIEIVPGPLSICRFAADTQQQPQPDSTDSATDSDSEADVVLHVTDAPQQSADHQLKQQQQGTGGAAVSSSATAAAAAPGDGTGGFRLARQADVLITDMFDYSVLGQGVLGALHSAAAADLLAPQLRLVPEQVTVRGQLVNTLMTQRVSGFDLTPINRYKWHPTIEHIDHSRTPRYTEASPAVTLQTINLATYVHPTDSSHPTVLSNPNTAATTSLLPGCSADALLVWFEMSAGLSIISTGPAPSAHSTAVPGHVQAAVRAADAALVPQQDSPTGHKPATHSANRSSGVGSIGKALSSEASGSVEGHVEAAATASSCSTQQELLYSRSMGMGLHYLDDVLPAHPTTQHDAAPQVFLMTTAHSPAAARLVFTAHALQQSQPSCTVSTTTPGQSTGQLVTRRSHVGGADPAEAGGSNLEGSTASDVCSWSPHGFPRHAWLPRWHFDMLADTARNDAYEAALRRALANIKATSKRAHVLDLGAGTGLLSMLAVRCGADISINAAAVESVRHMADTANSVLAINMVSGIDVVHKDARFLNSDDIRNEMHDLLVFEVFDCGCIGEGALHIVTAARKHLIPGAQILPASAQVYCQPIQYGAHIDQRAALPYDTAPLAPYAWQQDYFEADLFTPATDQGACHSSRGDSLHTQPPAQHSNWKALAAPQPVFDFDLNTQDPLRDFQPADRQLSFTITAAGVWNAVAFWFDLKLDEHTTLSSSPYLQDAGRPSTTWKQAVQLLPEHRVQPGQVTTLTASHDTYSISFSAPPATAPAAPATCEDLPQPTTGRLDTTHEVATPPLAKPPVPVTPTGVAQGGQHASLQPKTVEEPGEVLGPPKPTDVPLFDGLWRAAYDQLTALQSQIVKAVAQDPLEHRRVVAAALQLAMQPWKHPETHAEQHQQQQGDLAADPHHAAALLTRLMS